MRDQNNSTRAISSNMSVSNPSLPQSILNMECLNSGEFNPSQETATGTVSYDGLKGPNAPLEYFHKSTLEAYLNAQNMKNMTDARAAATMDAWDGLPMKSESKTPSIVNLDFLRSGKEFTDNVKLAMNDVPLTPPRERKSRNERLEEFYNAMLKPHTSDEAKESMDCWDGMSSTSSNVGRRGEVAAPSVINMDFLRSGAEFNRAPYTNGSTMHGPASNVLSSRNARLEKFYAKTLAAHQSN